MKNKILVTGGSGFIGLHLSNKLLKYGYKVNCLDLIKKNNFPKKNFKFFKGNINNTSIIKKSIKDCNIVIHLAASLGVENTDKNYLNCLDLNIYGTRKVLDIANNSGVKKFIFVSSSEVYGEQNKFPINENAELKNKSIYAISKIVGEKYLEGFNQKYGLSYNIIRFFNVYGLKQKPNFVMSKFADQIINNKNLTVYGSGKQIRSFCNIDDAVEGLIQVIKFGRNNKVYNIGNNKEPITILNLAKKFIKISGKNLKVKKYLMKKVIEKKIEKF